MTKSKNPSQSLCLLWDGCKWQICTRGTTQIAGIQTYHLFEVNKPLCTDVAYTEFPTHIIASGSQLRSERKWIYNTLIRTNHQFSAQFFSTTILRHSLLEILSIQYTILHENNYVKHYFKNFRKILSSGEPDVFTSYNPVFDTVVGIEVEGISKKSLFIRRITNRF